MNNPASGQSLSDVPMFFIIGRPRSGTTMLRMLFEAHPHVIIPPESPFIISLYKKYGKVRVWDDAVIQSFTDDLMKQRYFDKWLVSKEELLAHLLKVRGECTFQTMVKQVCLAYQSVYNKQTIQLIGDKNPYYSLYIRRIHKLFPEAKIIHLTRDYRDNYLSLINVNFEVPIVPLVVYRWKFAWRLAGKLKKQHSGLVYSLRYEDLAVNPETEFGKLCNFLGIEFDPSVMKFYEKKPEVEKAYAGSNDINVIHKSLLNPISTSRMNLWKTQMTPKQIHIAEIVAGKTGEIAGYEREYPGFNPWLWLQSLPMQAYGYLMYQMLLLGDHLPHRLRNSLGRFLGIFLKVYWSLNKRKVKPLK
ncbi:MAG: sulfotransferase [Bacteroidales bacterium]|nr:sulfotransferase [Bacteroidales bacterium]